MLVVGCAGSRVLAPVPRVGFQGFGGLASGQCQVASKTDRSLGF